MSRYTPLLVNITLSIVYTAFDLRASVQEIGSFILIAFIFIEIHRL